ncbi:MAG: hypothetical protein Q4F85_05290 [Prevotella sp.]|nr:hypothetical protein [Prevotella sp.]
MKPFKVYVIVSGFDFGCQNVIFQFAEVPLAVRRAAHGGSPNGAWRFIQPMRNGSATVVITLTTMQGYNVEKPKTNLLTTIDK